MLSLALILAVAPLPSGPDSGLARLGVTVDSSRRTVTLAAGRFILPGSMGHHMPGMMHEGSAELPMLRFSWPVDGWVRAARLRLTDSAGKPLARQLVHHINLINLGRRQLAYAVPERLMAMGQETEDIVLPASVGVPVTRGMPMGVVLAWHNETGRTITGVTVTLELEYSPSTMVPKPLSVYPVYLDVRNPVAQRVDFDLPAGKSEWKADVTLPVSGRIIGVGGHLHDYGVSLALEDVSTPSPRALVTLHARLDKAGKLLAVPRQLPGLKGDGIRIDSQRRYRVVGKYDNPTGAVIPLGAMVHLVMLYAPDDPARWPAVSQQDPDFVKDVARLEARGKMQE